MPATTDASHQPIDHLVVGVDRGEYSWDALEAVRAVASSVGASVRGFHATPGEVPDALADRALAAGLPLDSGVSAETPADAIVEHAGTLAHAVVALTSHARRGLTAALLGSTAASVLERSVDPIVLFGPHHEGVAEISRVVACVDGSDLSEAIVPAACRWARAADVPLWLVHVVEVDASATVGGADTNYLQRLAGEVDAADVDLEFDVLHGPHPGRSIGDYANDAPGTLTAIATHGRSGLRAVTMGSVAMEVVRRSHGPTLVQRPR